VVIDDDEDMNDVEDAEYYGDEEDDEYKLLLDDWDDWLL